MQRRSRLLPEFLLNLAVGIFTKNTDSQGPGDAKNGEPDAYRHTTLIFVDEAIVTVSV